MMLYQVFHFVIIYLFQETISFTVNFYGVKLFYISIYFFEEVFQIAYFWSKEKEW